MFKIQKIYFSVIVWAMTFVFTVTSVPAYAMPSLAVQPQSSSPELLFDPQSFEIPSTAGKIDAFHSGFSSTDPFVIHIQTVHGNYEVQKNIQQILEHVYREYGIKNILVEGESFDLDPESLRIFEDQKVNQEILENLASQGFIKGVELFMQKHEDVKAFGIEEASSYLGNGEDFAEVLKNREASEHYIAELQESMTRISRHYLNPSLKDWMIELENYEVGRIPFETWMRMLSEHAKQSLQLDFSRVENQMEWPMLVRYAQIVNADSMWNAEEFASERGLFLSDLQKNGFKPQYLDAVKSLLEPAVQSSRDFSTDEMESLLGEVIQALGLDFDYGQYPQVQAFVLKKLLGSELDATLLWQELDKLEDSLSAKLSENDFEGKWVAVLKKYRLIQKVFALELTPQDYERVLKQRNELLPSVFSSEVQALFESKQTEAKRVKGVSFNPSESLDDLYRTALRFYRGAKTRDLEMIRNVEEKLTELEDPRVVVITGGFHSEPFESYFSQLGVHYALISPKLTEISEELTTNYHSNMIRFFSPARKATIEDPFQSGGLTALISPFLYFETFARSHSPRGLIPESKPKKRSEKRNYSERFNEAAELAKKGMNFLRENVISDAEKNLKAALQIFKELAEIQPQDELTQLSEEELKIKTRSDINAKKVERQLEKVEELKNQKDLTEEAALLAIISRENGIDQLTVQTLNAFYQLLEVQDADRKEIEDLAREIQALFAEDFPGPEHQPLIDALSEVGVEEGLDGFEGDLFTRAEELKGEIREQMKILKVGPEKKFIPVEEEPKEEEKPDETPEPQEKKPQPEETTQPEEKPEPKAKPQPKDEGIKVVVSREFPYALEEAERFLRAFEAIRFEKASRMVGDAAEKYVLPDDTYPKTTELATVLSWTNGKVLKYLDAIEKYATGYRVGKPNTGQSVISNMNLIKSRLQEASRKVSLSVQFDGKVRIIGVNGANYETMISFFRELFDSGSWHLAYAYIPEGKWKLYGALIEEVKKSEGIPDLYGQALTNVGEIYNAIVQVDPNVETTFKVFREIAVQGWKLKEAEGFDRELLRQLAQAPNAPFLDLIFRVRGIYDKTHFNSKWVKQFEDERSHLDLNEKLNQLIDTGFLNMVIRNYFSGVNGLMREQEDHSLIELVELNVKDWLSYRNEFLRLELHVGEKITAPQRKVFQEKLQAVRTEKDRFYRTWSRTLLEARKKEVPALHEAFMSLGLEGGDPVYEWILDVFRKGKISFVDALILGVAAVTDDFAVQEHESQVKSVLDRLAKIDGLNEKNVTQAIQGELFQDKPATAYVDYWGVYTVLTGRGLYKEKSFEAYMSDNRGTREVEMEDLKAIEQLFLQAKQMKVITVHEYKLVKQILSSHDEFLQVVVDSEKAAQTTRDLNRIDRKMKLHFRTLEARARSVAFDSFNLTDDEDLPDDWHEGAPDAIKENYPTLVNLGQFFLLYDRVLANLLFQHAFPKADVFVEEGEETEEPKKPSPPKKKPAKKAAKKVAAKKAAAEKTDKKEEKPAPKPEEKVEVDESLKQGLAEYFSDPEWVKEFGKTPQAFFESAKDNVGEGLNEKMLEALTIGIEDFAMVWAYWKVKDAKDEGELPLIEEIVAKLADTTQVLSSMQVLQSLSRVKNLFRNEAIGRKKLNQFVLGFEDIDQEVKKAFIQMIQPPSLPQKPMDFISKKVQRGQEEVTLRVNHVLGLRNIDLLILKAYKKLTGSKKVTSAAVQAVIEEVGGELKSEELMSRVAWMNELFEGKFSFEIVSGEVAPGQAAAASQNRRITHLDNDLFDALVYGKFKKEADVPSTVGEVQKYYNDQLTASQKRNPTIRGARQQATSGQIQVTVSYSDGKKEKKTVSFAQYAKLYKEWKFGSRQELRNEVQILSDDEKRLSEFLSADDPKAYLIKLFQDGVYPDGVLLRFVVRTKEEAERLLAIEGFKSDTTRQDALRTRLATHLKAGQPLASIGFVNESTIKLHFAEEWRVFDEDIEEIVLHLPEGFPGSTFIDGEPSHHLGTLISSLENGVFSVEDFGADIPISVSVPDQESKDDLLLELDLTEGMEEWLKSEQDYRALQRNVVSEQPAVVGRMQGEKKEPVAPKPTVQRTQKKKKDKDKENRKPRAPRKRVNVVESKPEPHRDPIWLVKKRKFQAQMASLQSMQTLLHGSPVWKTLESKKAAKYFRQFPPLEFSKTNTDGGVIASQTSGLNLPSDWSDMIRSVKADRYLSMTGDIIDRLKGLEKRVGSSLYKMVKKSDQEFLLVASSWWSQVAYNTLRGLYASSYLSFEEKDFLLYYGMYLSQLRSIRETALVVMWNDLPNALRKHVKLTDLSRHFWLHPEFDYERNDLLDPAVQSELGTKIDVIMKKIDDWRGDLQAYEESAKEGAARVSSNPFRHQLEYIDGHLKVWAGWFKKNEIDESHKPTFYYTVAQLIHLIHDQHTFRWFDISEHDRDRPYPGEESMKELLVLISELLKTAIPYEEEYDVDTFWKYLEVERKKEASARQDEVNVQQRFKRFFEIAGFEEIPGDGAKDEFFFEYTSDSPEPLSLELLYHRLSVEADLDPENFEDILDLKFKTSHEGDWQTYQVGDDTIVEEGYIIDVEYIREKRSEVREAAVELVEFSAAPELGRYFDVEEFEVFETYRNRVMRLSLQQSLTKNEADELSELLIQMGVFQTEEHSKVRTAEGAVNWIRASMNEAVLGKPEAHIVLKAVPEVGSQMFENLSQMLKQFSLSMRIYIPESSSSEKIKAFNDALVSAVGLDHVDLVVHSDVKALKRLSPYNRQLVFDAYHADDAWADQWTLEARESERLVVHSQMDDPSFALLASVNTLFQQKAFAPGVRNDADILGLAENLQLLAQFEQILAASA